MKEQAFGGYAGRHRAGEEEGFGQELPRGPSGVRQVLPHPVRSPECRAGLRLAVGAGSFRGHLLVRGVEWTGLCLPQAD